MINEPGSFRDPAGRIFYYQGKVYRKLSSTGTKRINYLTKNGILKKLIDNNLIIKTEVIEENQFGNLGLTKFDQILEHEKIPYLSYPYEWSFSQLKAAAIFHLDLQLFLLELNATLLDASAYNIQFIDSKPIFIDILSIDKYIENDPWKGHRQFCENFLNPLILKSKKGIKFNNWFRGNLEGIETSDLNKILSFFDKFSYNIFSCFFA